MVLVEGVGRRLDPEINIWALSQPLIESWMRDNRGPEARLRERLDIIVDMLDRLPRVIEKVENFVEDVARDGVLLHAESIASHAQEQAKRAWLLVLPFYIAAAALVAIAADLIFWH
jgi:ubiquinone biosynthesis protein